MKRGKSPRVSGGEAGPPRPLPIPAFPGEREGGCAVTGTVRHRSKQPLREMAPSTSPRPPGQQRSLQSCPSKRDVRVPNLPPTPAFHQAGTPHLLFYFSLIRQRHCNLQGTVFTVFTFRCNPAHRCPPASCGTSCRASACPRAFPARCGFFSQRVPVPGTSKPPTLEQRLTPETPSS